MKKLKTKKSFARLPVPRLITFTDNVTKKMDKNVLFPTPDVALTDVIAANNNLSSKYQASRNRGKEEIAKMHEVTIILITILYKLADYVDRIADGVESVILSAGFEAVKDKTPALRPEFKVIVGAEHGQVILIHKAVKGAASYLWQYVTDPIPADDKLWLLAGVSVQAKCVIENLDSGVKYWFKVTPITRKGPLPHSEPIMKIAP